MRIYDISVPISPQTVIYPDDPDVRISHVSSISAGGEVNISEICLGSHTGTHVDPPSHMLENGLTVDQLPLDRLIGNCLVCRMDVTSEIGIAELEAAEILHGTERILFKTRNSELWNRPEFSSDFIHLSSEAAGWLVKRGINLVGIDYLSIDAFGSDTLPAHRKLLEAGIIIVEGLDLSAVSEGMYTLVCLPLKILNGDGGPARAILISH